MKHKPERIDSVVKSVIQKLDGQANPAGAGNIERIWQEAAGEKAARHAKPVSLREKQLAVNVDGSGWLYELTLRKKELLARLKKSLGGDKIDGIIFRIGEM